MALDRLDALEDRIKDLVKLIQELKKKNAAAEDELKLVKQRLAEKDDSNRRWEQEARSDIPVPYRKKFSATSSCWSALKNARKVALTKTIDVEIYGSDTRIRGEADEADIRRLASFVDSQMRQLAEGMNTTTPSKLAVFDRPQLSPSLFELERKRAQGKRMSSGGWRR